jgi:hypothetical protein
MGSDDENELEEVVYQKIWFKIILLIYIVK